MNPFRTISNLWKAVRDLQEAVRQLQGDVAALKAAQGRRSAQRDWVLTKLVPAVSACGLLFVGLDSIFHWTT